MFVKHMHSQLTAGRSGVGTYGRVSIEFTDQEEYAAAGDPVEVVHPVLRAAIVEVFTLGGDEMSADRKAKLYQALGILGQ